MLKKLIQLIFVLLIFTLLLEYIKDEINNTQQIVTDWAAIPTLPIVHLPQDIKLYNCKELQPLLGKLTYCVLKQDRKLELGQPIVKGEFHVDKDLILMDYNPEKRHIIHELKHHYAKCLRIHKEEEEMCNRSNDKLIEDLKLLQ